MSETDTILPDTRKLLIKGCIAGERSSQARLYQLYAPKMMAVCLWYARNREEAEEILQDGFMRVFTYIHTYSGAGSMEGWIRKIMVNAALYKYKGKFSALNQVIELKPDIYDPCESISLIEELDAKELVALVQQLPPSYRIVFNLHILEGFKHREIADILGISEGTSKSNLAAARALLQKRLTPKKKVAVL